MIDGVMDDKSDDDDTREVRWSWRSTAFFCKVQTETSVISLSSFRN